MSKLALFPAVILLGAIFVVFPVPVFGDPPVLPPDPATDVVLPKLFCIRITDIRADKTDTTLDAEGNPNKFTFEFEVLNWSNQQANDVHFMLTAESGDVVFTSAGVDQNGRPLIPWPVGGPLVPDEDVNLNGMLDVGEDLNGDGRLTNDLLEGNEFTNNNFFVASSSGTSIMWQGGFDDVDYEFPSFIPLAHAGEGGQSIPPLNILGNAADGEDADDTGTNEVNAFLMGAIPDITSIDSLGNVNPREAIDNGGNTLDGFTFTVDNLDKGDTFSINWFLTNFGSPIGTSFSGNDYGFGVISFARADDVPVPDPVYMGNTGFQQTLLEFYGNVFVVPDPASMLIELGAGVTAPFKNPSDNIFGSAPNFFPPAGAVGGSYLPVDSTSLIVAGTQSTISWLIPLLVSAIGIGIVLVRRK